ncbi:MAG: hypothetical protein ACP5OV_02965 [Acidimicrobiales bacterium]
MSVLVACAVGRLLEGASSMIFSVNDVRLQASSVSESFTIGQIHLGLIYVAGFLLVAELLKALYDMLDRPRFAMSVRAWLTREPSRGTGPGWWPAG